jgi:hypothetical protein
LNLLIIGSLAGNVHGGPGEFADADMRDKRRKTMNHDGHEVITKGFDGGGLLV